MFSNASFLKMGCLICDELLSSEGKRHSLPSHLDIMKCNITHRNWEAHGNINNYFTANATPELVRARES